jgi:hypothetical protein
MPEDEARDAYSGTVIWLPPPGPMRQGSVKVA